MQIISFELQPNIANRIETIIQLFGTKEIMFDMFFGFSYQ